MREAFQESYYWTFFFIPRCIFGIFPVYFFVCLFCRSILSDLIASSAWICFQWSTFRYVVSPVSFQKCRNGPSADIWSNNGCLLRGHWSR